MRKAVALVVLAAFVVLALAVPAFAAPVSSAVPPAQKVCLTGKVVYSYVSGQHYELVVVENAGYPNSADRRVSCKTYVLVSKESLGRYLGRQVTVCGKLYEGPNIYGKPIVLVEKILLPVALPVPAAKSSAYGK